MIANDVNVEHSEIFSSSTPLQRSGWQFAEQLPIRHRKPSQIEKAIIRGNGGHRIHFRCGRQLATSLVQSAQSKELPWIDLIDVLE